ncbi:MAG: SIMPL domain-containing protein [Aigarchaeota archaeon]|nr:SIMPL domain-containing protein [Aigarchaeota archaeon]MDW8093087.1 SIMPL domain-containing protein [Nitrososphaerota archaeon]
MEERRILVLNGIVLAALLAATLVSLIIIGGISERLGEAAPAERGGVVTSAFGNGGQQRVLNVVGVGTVRATPDQLVINLGVETRGKTAVEAMSRNNENMNAVIAALRNFRIPDRYIRTTLVSLQPIYVYDKSNEPVLAGYSAINSIEVTLRGDLMRVAPEVLDGAVRVGANKVDGIRASFSDELMRQLKTEAMKGAIDDARSRANEVARGLGISIARVLSVSIVSEYFPAAGAYAPPRQAAGEVTTPIFPGEQTYTVSVNVVFEIS